jgi:hypothetical protein
MRETEMGRQGEDKNAKCQIANVKSIPFIYDGRGSISKFGIII